VGKHGWTQTCCQLSLSTTDAAGRGAFCGYGSLDDRAGVADDQVIVHVVCPLMGIQDVGDSDRPIPDATKDLPPMLMYAGARLPSTPAQAKSSSGCSESTNSLLNVFMEEQDEVLVWIDPFSSEF
jgi:hypothetical protein